MLRKIKRSINRAKLAVGAVVVGAVASAQAQVTLPTEASFTAQLSTAETIFGGVAVLGLAILLYRIGVKMMSKLR
jgi:hypothetical protein